MRILHVRRLNCNTWVVLVMTLLGASAMSLCAQSAITVDTLGRRSRTYDVIHYRIEVRLEEEQRQVRGTTSITFTPLVSRLDSIALDAVALEVTSVTLSDGVPLRFANRSKQLAVYFPRSLSFAETLTVSVHYSCRPKQGLYFIQPDSTDGHRHRQIWSQGQDTDNRYWFPCYDYPNDNATSEVIATVKEDYVLVSNGALLKVARDKKEKTRTFHWRQSKPHVSYLIMVAAGNYEVLHDRYGSIPLQYYVYKDQVEDARRTFFKTPAMMRFFEEKIGYPYPWEKYAQIILDDFMWGGMENTSAVTLNSVTILDRRAALDFSSDDVISHELAHQWWGNVVTCRDWTHLWLNEGFADYYEALFKEYDKGRDEFQYGQVQTARKVIRTEQALGRRPLVSNDSYTENVYGKGAWVLHMLRQILGDEEFLRAMRYYIRRFEFRSVDTHEFELAVEDATGQNLQWFFDQWVYKAGYPELNVKWAWDDERKAVMVTVKQTQKMDSLGGVFVVPLDIECTTSKGRSLRRVWVNAAEQTFTLSEDEKPLMVTVDKGLKVLKSMVFEKSEEELVYQLERAEEMSDRLDAARDLRKHKESASVFRALVSSARHDRFWGVRREAAISVGVMSSDSVREALVGIFNDKDSRVRHAAIVGLERFKSPDVAQFMLRAARSDSSYVVQSACIRSLAVIDSSLAFDCAQRYVDMDSYRDLVREAALSVMYELRDLRGLAYGIKYAGPAWSVETRTRAISVVAELGEQDSTARGLLLRLTGDKNSRVRNAAVRALGDWEGDEIRSVLESRQKTEEDPGVLNLINDALRRMNSESGRQKE